jgi:hypothetical protein
LAIGAGFFKQEDTTMNDEFFDAVKALTESVRGYLNSDTGDDYSHIVSMAESVDVLSKLELLRQQSKNET